MTKQPIIQQQIGNCHLQNRISNTVADSIAEPNRKHYRMRSQWPISIVNFQLGKYPTLPPSTSYDTPSHRRRELSPAAEERNALTAASDSGSASSRLPPSLDWGFMTAITNETANQALMHEIRNAPQERKRGGKHLNGPSSHLVVAGSGGDGALHRLRRRPSSRRPGLEEL